MPGWGSHLVAGLWGYPIISGCERKCRKNAKGTAVCQTVAVKHTADYTLMVLDCTMITMGYLDH